MPTKPLDGGHRRVRWWLGIYLAILPIWLLGTAVGILLMPTHLGLAAMITFLYFGAPLIVWLVPPVYGLVVGVIAVRRGSLRAAALGSLAPVLVMLLVAAGRHGLTYPHFLLNRPYLDCKIGSQPEECPKAGILGFEPRIDRDGDRFAVFLEGLLDNWTGYVFDPTGAVARPFPGWTPEWREDPVTKLFDGDLIACRHLAGAWYHCGFT